MTTMLTMATMAKLREKEIEGERKRYCKRGSGMASVKKINSSANSLLTYFRYNNFVFLTLLRLST